MIKVIESSIQSRKVWALRSLARAIDKGYTLAVGFGERPDVQGGTGSVKTFLENFPLPHSFYY